jgi:hypothetical protein
LGFPDFTHRDGAWRDYLAGDPGRPDGGRVDAPRRFPLASYGFFVFLILLAPTSSILPIKDPVAERRIYFAMLGLLLIVVDVLAR